MRHIITTVVVMAFILSGCAMKSAEKVYWINSSKIDCTGVGPMKCLQVQKGEVIDDDNWQSFYSSIAGFDYKQGYIYKLLVHEESLPPQKVAADASSIKYTLLEVLSKNIDPKRRLHDLWVAEKIQGDFIVLNDRQKRPRLEINLTKMQVMGTDGCNHFTGSIKSLGADKIELSGIASTRMLCPDMNIANLFSVQMSKVHGYMLNGLKLHLLDEKGGELLIFQKTD